jgi:Holliday junction resolvase-like predicted endonuclease
VQLKINKMNETAIKEQIKNFLEIQGFFTPHIMARRWSYKGFPDRIAVKNGVVLFIEVKTEKGKQSEHQVEFQKQIEDHGGIYLLVRSVDDIIDYCERNKLCREINQGKLFS